MKQYLYLNKKNSVLFPPLVNSINAFIIQKLPTHSGHMRLVVVMHQEEPRAHFMSVRSDSGSEDFISVFNSCIVLGCEYRYHYRILGSHATLIESVSISLVRNMYTSSQQEVILEGTGSIPPCPKEQIPVLWPCPVLLM